MTHCKNHSCGCSTKPAVSGPALRTPLILGLVAAAAAVPAILFGVGLSGQPATAPAPAKPGTPVPAAVAPAAPAEPEGDHRPPGVMRHGITEAIPTPQGAVRIASYNIENLFDAGVDKPAGDDEGSTTEPKPEDHKASLAKAIRAVNADILALQEIESKDTLIRFRDSFLADMGYTHVSSLDAGDGRGIEQAVLSRFPITSEINWPDKPLGGTHPETVGSFRIREAGRDVTFARSPLQVTIEVPARPGVPDASNQPFTLTLLVVHHKSGRSYDYWREKEAAGVLEIASELTKADPNAAVIIAGDFNARPNDKSVRLYTEGGWVDAFADIRQGAGGAAGGGGGNGGDRSVRVDPKYMTHVSNRAIDHLLLSPGAARKLVRETRFVLGTLQRAEGVDWRTTLPPAGYASDHYPVVIDLKP
jgi:endonuclease/exonuclease/phosphatase family metal-dependent hydrolase